MVTQTNSRALLKKLSALRAILSDAERDLLDTLLLNSCENAFFFSEDAGTHDDDNIATGGRAEAPSSERKEWLHTHIKFDKEREMYVIE